jgi:hypothetical protein
MEMILLDWTRMGRTYCLVGVVAEAGKYRVVRPLPSRQRNSPQRNVGWSPFLLEGHRRWEIFELIKPEPPTASRRIWKITGSQVCGHGDSWPMCFFDATSCRELWPIRMSRCLAKR